MKQTTDYPALGGSASVAGMFSELVVGAITGVAYVRMLFFRAVLLVAIIVAAVSFTIGMMFQDYLPSKPVPAVQGTIPAPEPTRDRQARPPPSKRNDEEELQRLIRKDPL